MPANVEGMVREGVNAYRVGRKEEARALLLRAVEIDQYNEQAWLWLSAVVETVEEQRTCLENVLTINPNNERARQGMDVLAKKSGAAAPPPAAGPTPSDEDVLASSVFAAATDEEAPPSIDWGTSPAPPTATSSSSTYYPVNEPSAQEYDSWVANLGLGSGGEDQQPATAGSESSSAFATAFVEDDDLFGAEGDALAMDTPPSPAKTETSPSAPSSPPEGRRTSPAPKSPLQADSGDALLDELDESQDDLLVSDFDENYDEAELGKIDPEEMFRYIPKEIKATRLPGTRERYPIPLLVGLLVVVLLDIGAVVFLISQLSTASGS